MRANSRQIEFYYLNVGHFLDHLVMLIFATVAALHLSQEWGLSYGELIPYATPGFVAFGACALLSGWLADKWSRDGMMAIFFIGLGVSTVLCGFVNTPLQMAVALTAVGLFASIYHPVGLAMVVQGRKNTGIPLAINGVYGNMGVAVAALLTGYLIDTVGWRSAFYIPGVISILAGVGYLHHIRSGRDNADPEPRFDARSSAAKPSASLPKSSLWLVFSIVIFTTAIGGLVFQSTTFSLPKVFDEELSTSPTAVGWYSFLVFSIAAFAQLVVGYLVDNHSIRTVFTVVAAMQALLFAVMTQVSGIASVAIAVGFMLFVFGQIPINDVLVGRVVKSEWRSRAFAARYIVTFSVMASAIPLIGWIHGNWGFSALFSVLAVSALLIFMATLLLPRQSISAAN
ncbi:MAG: MFS transporter [Pseudomonadota bacterium]